MAYKPSAALSSNWSTVRSMGVKLFAMARPNHTIYAPRIRTIIPISIQFHPLDKYLNTPSCHTCLHSPQAIPRIHIRMIHSSADGTLPKRMLNFSCEEAASRDRKITKEAVWLMNFTNGLFILRLSSKNGKKKQRKAINGQMSTWVRTYNIRNTIPRVRQNGTPLNTQLMTRC